MAYTQSPGRMNMPKTGRGVDIPTLMTGSPARQDKKTDPVDGGVWDTVKKVGRTAADIARTSLTQLGDFMQPDANKFGGDGSRESTFDAQATKRAENTRHQEVIDRSKSGSTFPIAGKIAAFNQDTGYSSSLYKPGEEQKSIQEGVKKQRGYEKKK